MLKQYNVSWVCEMGVGTKICEARNQGDALMQILKMIAIDVKVPSCQIKVSPIEA